MMNSRFFAIDAKEFASRTSIFCANVSIHPPAIGVLGAI
jgi:hypothetical protein